MPRCPFQPRADSAHGRGRSRRHTNAGTAGSGSVRAPSLDGRRDLSDEERAAEINGLLADRSLRGIVALRGGWGCARLLPHLDYRIAQERPKVVLGFSDVAAILLALNARAGLVTFHGPLANSEWSARAMTALRHVLFDARSSPLSRATGTTVHRGGGRGRLLGGNRTVLCSLIGSPYVPSAPDVLLFLEEVQEPFSEVDRGLTPRSPSWMPVAGAGGCSRPLS